VQSLSRVWADIVKRPYITIGMAGFACLVPLALTSNDRAVRRLGGPRWRQLHRLTYVAVALGTVHFVMQAKGWQIEPLVYLGGAGALLGWRMLPQRKRLA
jgi:sulfoxide reductase heme-binding subunit YedZ